MEAWCGQTAEPTPIAIGSDCATISDTSGVPGMFALKSHPADPEVRKCMIAVIQRVKRAKVTVADRVAGEIDAGLVVLAAVMASDTDADLNWTAAKIAGLRVFPSEKGDYDLDVRQAGGKVLLVSNFTVAGDTSSGRRPGWSAAMSPDAARPVFDRFIDMVRAQGAVVATGQFGAEMEVHIVNDGPLTVIVDSKRK